ncbi:putative bifunctional diguanylate cyclase/phosphodiesterase [Bacillus tuaregi]|uniref:putative bifunctional diguanylate cyclase/phosphodiesterase n=1 Tax=Bacillus tuaregi TaxID=1816695 RepID=UPI0008F8FA64|nr:EAL domain-containing protein [Bacillus tuaregi]
MKPPALSVTSDLFDQIAANVFITNQNGCILTVNSFYLNRSGYTLEEVIGHTIQDFIEGLDHPNGDLQEEVRLKIKGKRAVLQQLLVNPRNRTVTAEPYTIWLLKDFQVCGYDSLTNLPNRHLMNQEIQRAIVQAQKNKSIFAVLFLDLDRFKFVNDTLGHSYGDDLLQEVSVRIRKAIGTNHTISRMGGDEFVCLLEEIENGREAEEVARRIIDQFSLPFLLKETDLYMTTSIGISLYPFDGDEADVLITNADSAMYGAKKKGRNQYSKAKVEWNAGGYEKLLLENSLRQAIKENQFVLHFQPQIQVKKNQIMSMEALIRWNHPDLGLLMPGEFIPIAEESGLILQIGDWVLRTACEKMKQWLYHGNPPIRVAVNLAAGQFLQRNFVEKVRQILVDTSLDASYLELEITENMVMNDVKTGIQVLRQLKQLGVYISIDDFGTGYSSLNYLKELTVDTLKIDRSFIFDIEKNPNSVVLTKAITALAHDLKLNVVAEGVETYKQLSLVKQCSCDTIQGYYFTKPLSYEETVSYIQSYEKSGGRLQHLL